MHSSFALHGCRRLSRFALVALTALLTTVNASAQQASPPAFVVGTLPENNDAPVIDGRVNDAVWDSQLGTTEVSDLLRSAGVQMIRYPGGSYGDIYHWKDNTAPGGYVAPGTDFDTFMGSVRRVGAQPP